MGRISTEFGELSTTVGLKSTTDGADQTWNPQDGIRQSVQKCDGGVASTLAGIGRTSSESDENDLCSFRSNQFRLVQGGCSRGRTGATIAALPADSAKIWHPRNEAAHGQGKPCQALRQNGLRTTADLLSEKRYSLRKGVSQTP